MTKRKNTERTITLKIELPVIVNSVRVGGLHAAICKSEADGHSIVVSSGYGLGNLDIYVAVDDARVLTVPTANLIQELVRAAMGVISEDL